MKNERWRLLLVLCLWTVVAKAQDFTFATTDGVATRLTELPADRLTVMVFFDPECTTCRQELFQMRHSSVLKQAVEKGRIQVLTVCVEEDREAWLKMCEEMPSWWIKAESTEEPFKISAYDLTSLPATYLLDSDKQVLLRVRDYAQLCELLNE